MEVFHTWTEKECEAANGKPVPEELRLYDDISCLITKKAYKGIYYHGKIEAALRKIRADPRYLLEFDYIQRGDFLHVVKEYKLVRHIRASGLGAELELLAAYDEWLLSRPFKQTSNVVPLRQETGH